MESNNFKSALNAAATNFNTANANLIKAQNALILARNNFNSALNDFNTAQNALNTAAASDFYHFLGEAYEILKKAAPNVPQNPQNAQFFYSLARAAISHENYAYAEQILLWLCNFLDIAPVKIELGLLYLRIGQWERGFELFESRIELNNGFGYLVDFHKQANSAKAKFLAQNENLDSMPNSDSLESKNNFLAQKRVIIYCTQGAGDDLMFVRFLEPLLKIAQKVFFGVRSSQMRLFSAAFGENGSLQNYSKKAYLFEFNTNKDMKFSQNFKTDFCFSLCSLPYFLGISSFLEPFLVLNSKQNSINLKGKLPKIAIAWRTTSGSCVADLRSFSLKEILENFYFENAEFISIQTEPNAEECELMKKYKIKDESKNLKDFYSTFEILRKCDFAICLDSAPFHLAQAANIRTIAILPRYFEWRFGQGIIDSQGVAAVSSETAIESIESKIAPIQQNKIDSINSIESIESKSAKLAKQTKSPWYPSAKCFACPTLGDFAAPLKAAQIFIKNELGL